MSTQSLYTPAKAAQVIGCTEKDVLSHIKDGRLRATYMENIANYVINHEDLLQFLKATRNFQTVGKMLTQHILVVDRDPTMLDILRMELGREGCEVKAASSPREISVYITDFRPDLICMHLNAPLRGRDSFKPAIDRARSVCKSTVILYHDFAPNIVASPEIQRHLQEIQHDVLVTTDKVKKPLIDAIRGCLGIRPGATSVKRKATTRFKRPTTRRLRITRFPK